MLLDSRMAEHHSPFITMDPCRCHVLNAQRRACLQQMLNRLVSDSVLVAINP